MSIFLASQKKKCQFSWCNASYAS